MTDLAFDHTTPSCGRRRFLGASLGAAAAVVLPLPALARSQSGGILKFGVISDLHQDVMHDAPRRVAAFVDAMKREKVDFITQLGDFCQPKEPNREFLNSWNRYEGPRFHVLGNHDMDGGFKREQVVAFLGMPGRYYAFDNGGIRFIVLDGNDPGGTSKGYKRYIAADQMAWLEKELSETPLPVVVMVHQPLESSGGIENQEKIRGILEKDRGPGHPGTIAVLTGHLHQDYVRTIGGIAHIQINSASYVWLPANAKRTVYDEATHKAHPHLAQVAPYQDPVWAVVTIDHQAGTLSIQGRATQWVGPDPWSRGAPENDYPRETNRPAVSDWSGKILPEEAIGRGRD